VIVAGERSAVQWGGTRIGYSIRRSQRRGTVSIAVDPEQGVLVTAPKVVAVARLDGVVRRKARWIVERMRDRTVLERPSAKEFVSGETFRYLGRSYRLRVREGLSETVALRAGWLQVTTPRDRGDVGAPARVRTLLAAWYRRHAAERLPEIVSRWASRLTVEPRSILVREAPKRWGSCDTQGNLRLNWRVVQAPPRLIEYVVAHELVHLRHEHHTAAFWAALGRVMPDYESRREDLRRVGGAFLW
jgi:predicted metal-dependent hydrolase